MQTRHSTCSLPGAASPMSNESPSHPVDASPPSPSSLDSATVLDVEHVAVIDDPRKWSSKKKWLVFSIVTFANIAGGLAGNIYFPAINEVKRDLGASDNDIALTVSLFILVQGTTPLIWSAISEVKGRRLVYTISNIIFVAASIACSRANSVPLFLVSRICQACGSSAVMALGAGSLADMYETEERGTKIGLYYTAPLLGPTIGTFLGGLLTSGFGWRSTFYFLIAFGGICSIGFLVLPDTFRKERSLAWRAARQRTLDQTLKSTLSITNTMEETTSTPSIPPPAPVYEQGIEMGKVETQSGQVRVQLSLRDINPLSAAKDVFKCPKNLVAILLSCAIFAIQWCVTYTASLDLAKSPYSYGSLDIGLVLVSLGIGSIIGSTVGGRFSDWTVTKRKATRGGIPHVEDRLYSIFPWAMVLTPATVLTYGWVVKQPIACLIVVLFFIGASLLWEYSSILAYIVDNNRGRATSAVACNSAFRGISACIASQVAGPVIKAIGNGPLYSIEAGIVSLLSVLVVVICIGVRRRPLPHQVMMA